MADIFNKDPQTYVDMNELFPVLNERVGLTYEQWRKAIENINFVKANLGVSDVEIGNVNKSIVEDENLVGIDITTREGIIEKNGVQRTVIYLDFDLRFYSGKVKSVNGQTGNVIIDLSNKVDSLVGSSKIINDEDKILLSRVLETTGGSLSNDGCSIDISNDTIMLRVFSGILASGIFMSKDGQVSIVGASFTKNGIEVATLDDVNNAIGNVSTLLGDTDDLEV